MIFSIASFFWFGSFTFRTFMGDDLWLIRDLNKGGYASSFWKSFTEEVLGKYRPVFSAVFSLENKIFSQEWRNFFRVNIALHALNATCFSVLAYYFGGRRKWLALAGGLVFIVSRFSYHYVFQLWGMMEEIALSFLLLMVVMTAYAYFRKKLWALYLSTVLFLLITFTHERFLFLLPFCMASFFLFPDIGRNFFHRLKLSFIPVAVVAVNFLVKKYLIGVSFLAGAGSNTSAVADFSPEKILSLMWNGFINTLGFNAGPAYLAGLDFRRLGAEGYIPGVVFVVSLFLLLAAHILAVKKNKPSIHPVRVHLLFVIILFSLLASASVSVHQELRWLFAPSAILFLWSAYLIGTLRINYKTGLVSVLMILSFAYVNIFYRQYLNNIYFVRSLMSADSARKVIIDHYGKKLKKSDIIIVLNGYQSIKNWTFLDQYFFKYYIGDETHVHYVNNVDEIDDSMLEHGQKKVFSVKDDLMFEDISKKNQPD